MRQGDVSDPTQAGEGAGANADDILEFVVFGLGDEEYAVAMGKVREIRSYSASTPLPEAPPYVLGIINLRGRVVPIVGLRERFGLPPVEPDRQTVVIILELADRTVGLVVDMVSDILRVDHGNIQPAPDYAAQSNQRGVDAVILEQSRLIGILSLDDVMGDFLDQSSKKEAA